MPRKTALIIGILGQDGAYLAALLLSKGYAVHGLARWDSWTDAAGEWARFDALGLRRDDITLHYGDMIDAQGVTAVIKLVQPDEIYNLAALSHVAVSFDVPAATFDINVKGTLALFEAVRILGMEAKTRIYQASSSEMFGSAPAPQNENTPFQPCSPYGAAKLSAYWLGRVYRESYGMFIANGILFNHESPVRGQGFVTRKVTQAVAEFIVEARSEPLMLGNLDALRDWGHARDYVDGMYRILNHAVADDFVLASGAARSVRDFVAAAFACAGINIVWRGVGVEEIGVDAQTGKTLVAVDTQFFRPNEVHHLLGDASKAREVLGWRPSYDFDSLVRDMVEADCRALRA